ncbi:tetratricopeptide repeat protein [Rhodovulum sp. P5]|uniref:tetratricopeptide repeat protein n=1 Tax=Rhodovulum sp. P5 TaxID=1564506 RepID=UPI0020A43EE4|nr:tetratricopeptide repeat protein [Rhodovulum sp. P5]
MWSGPALAADDRAAELLQELQRPDLPNWKNVENAIWSEWSRSGSPSADLLLKRGRDAVEESDFDTAIAHLTALTDHAPDFAEGFNVRALAFFRSGRYGPAMADLERTLALNPSHFGALSGLGAILEEVGRYDDALRAFEAARAIHPHDPDLEDAVTRLERLTSGQTL